CQSLATGVRVRLTKTSKKAAAKGASRFYDNDAVSLRDLGAPLVVRAREAVKEHCQAYALCAHDVSRIAKRLLVAAQACVVIWALMRCEDSHSDSLRRFLMRLSGRMTKPGVEYTAPALFDGMHNLLAIADALDQYPVAEIRHMAGIVSQILGTPDDESRNR